MKSEYRPDELLALSGLQHFSFCRRQWALIHVECQWHENVLTVEGKLLHSRVDNPFFSETRGGVITARSMPVASYQLGLYGVCDVVEFTPALEGVRLPGREGIYQLAPVEYKRGNVKKAEIDEIQLCAQAMCLEEMLSNEIPFGYLYYGEIRHRVQIELTGELRSHVTAIALEMHSYFERGYTPHVKPSRACRSCSLEDVCMPELQGKTQPASRYIQSQIDRE